MNEVSNLINIFQCLLQNDPNIRVPAEKLILDIRKNHLIGFIETNFFILQNANDFPEQALHFSLLFVRLSFRKATKVKQSNDATNQHLLIPFEVANNFLPIVFPLLSNQNLSDFAAQLLGQISCYILSFDPVNQILSLICQQLSNSNVSIPCCTAIEYIFEEIEVPLQLQSIILPSVLPLLSNNEYPSQIKSKLIMVLTSMISSLPNFLSNREECSTFAQSMLVLTTIPPLKKSAYMFWDSAADFLPSIFNYIPNILELSFNDLRNYCNEEDENYDPDVVMSILQFWCNLGKHEMKEQGSLSNLLIPVISVFFPILILIYQNILDPNTLDSNEEWYPHIAARDCIYYLSTAFPSQSIPILLNYTQEAISSLSSNQSIILKETILFCFAVVIDSYISEDDESESSVQMKNISTQCIPIITQSLISNDGSPISIRVASQALKLLLSVIQNNPDLTDYSVFVEFLMNCMQNVRNPLCEDAKDILSEIVLLPNYTQNSVQIFERLLSFDNVPSLDCAQKILKNLASAEFAHLFLPKLIALAEIYAKDQLPTLQGNDQVVIDPLTCQLLLPFIIQMIIILVDLLDQEAIPFTRVLFNLMQQIFEQNEYPEALKAICSIVHITNQNVQYAVNLVIIALKNSIANEDNDTVIINSYEMRSTAITSITLYLSKCDVSQYFHELMRILLSLLEIQQDKNNIQSINTSLKIEILEAINSLHFAFPPLMKPYFGQLIPIFGFALNSIPSIISEDEENATQMNSAVLEGIKLLLLSGVDDATPIVLQMSLGAIKSAIALPTMNKFCMAEILDVLNILLRMSPNETKQFITSNEELNNLFEEAKEDPDLNEAINKLCALMK